MSQYSVISGPQVGSVLSVHVLNSSSHKSAVLRMPGGGSCCSYSCDVSALGCGSEGVVLALFRISGYSSGLVVRSSWELDGVRRCKKERRVGNAML